VHQFQATQLTSGKRMASKSLPSACRTGASGRRLSRRLRYDQSQGPATSDGGVSPWSITPY
jgi:hypothetical protein